ncbi:DNA repair ATPase-related family protein [Rhynchospora pubera]|uniref:DNA repair ATPase-related family protein n=1 Tax=Rhynchospora pubera TaxID=906938 RepID=A0AAV8HL57_9POAL|nr:DNA repair ATPase-related family protein [Rhynchospora pubera]
MIDAMAALNQESGIHGAWAVYNQPGAGTAPGRLVLKQVLRVERDLTMWATFLAGVGSDADSVALARERQIEKLKSKISYLESKYIDQENEIREKDKKLSLLEKSSQHKSTQVASLESEIALLKNRSRDDDETVHQANVKNHFLEKQIDKLQIELKTQVREREALESKVSKAEKTARELSQKLDHVSKIKDKQRLKLEQLDRDLKIAQNEILKVQARANLKAEELEKVLGAWIPQWVTSYVNQLQIAEKLTHLRDLIGPHMELASNAAYSKTSDLYGICADAITPHFFKFIKTIRPYLEVAYIMQTLQPYLQHMQVAYSKTTDVYCICMDAIEPHIVKVRKTMQPNLEIVKKHFGSYIAREKTASEPHATKVRLIYKHKKKSYLASMFMKIIDVVAMYHKQVQAITYGAFRKYGLLRPLATENKTWLFASSLLCAPLIALFGVLSSIFCKRRQSRRHRGASYKDRREKERKVWKPEDFLVTSEKSRWK